MKLLLIRHGTAEDLSATGRDEDRALTPEGHRELISIGQMLQSMELEFERITNSPLLRAQQSSEVISAYLPHSERNEARYLIPGTPYDEIVNGIEDDGPAKSICLIGHEPTLSGFASWLLAASNSSFIRFRKGGTMLLSTPGDLLPGRAELRWYVEPDNLLKL